jgi:ParB family transcriptional regulator, chromosome partitioning protein
MKGCSPHYHETLGLTDSVDTKLIFPPESPLRDYRDGLDDLTSSIKEKGLIEPIVVRPIGGTFEVVAGVRRFEACKRLRWSRVPCIIRNLSDKDAYEMSLTENIQRKTMNAVEEALAFRRYVDMRGWGGESVLAKKLGKSQEYISQRLSLLSLPKPVKQRIIRRQINPSVAVEIARVSDPQTQIALSQRVAEDHIPIAVVRQAVHSIKSGQMWQVAVEAARPNAERTSGKLPSSIPMVHDSQEPDFFGTRLGQKDAFQREMEQLDNGVLILKLALARLSTLVDNVYEESDVWEMLAEKRFLIHGMIDSLIKAKVKMNRRLGLIGKPDPLVLESHNDVSGEAF